ncbi:universal stress protein [Allosphingosinicella humi]|jgi:nucleotide-binding universal stress UspA family protein
MEAAFMFKSIVVPVDTGEPSSWAKALPTAIALAKANGAQLTITTVIPNVRAMVQAEWSIIAFQDMADTAHAQLGSIIGEFPDAPEVTTEVGCGSIWRGILEIAERVGADLIVLSSHRPAMKDYLIGANAVNVVRHAPCSVMVVRD